MSRVIGWCLGLVLALAGANIHDPYLMPVRGWSAPAIAVAGLCGLLVLLKRGVRRRMALAALWAAAPLAVLGAEGVFQARRGAVLSASDPLAAELGRHFIVGYERVEEVEALAARGLIGGVFISRRNLAGRSAEALREEIGRLQDIRRRAGLPPLRVAADQEGGIVSKLSPWLPNRPAPSALTGLAPDERRAAARALGRNHGRDLLSLGITINFAPVLDLRNDRRPTRWTSTASSRAARSQATRRSWRMSPLPTPPGWRRSASSRRSSIFPVWAASAAIPTTSVLPSRIAARHWKPRTGDRPAMCWQATHRRC